MIKLSYTTINNTILEPHTWLCKQMGLKTKEFSFMTEGREAHLAIQRHVSGIKKDDRLSKIKVKFPVVETIDFDPKTEFEWAYDKKYSIRGFMDGFDRESGRLLEIKTSTEPWGMAKFFNLMQWRVYALANPWIREVWCVTATRDLQRVGVYNLTVTPADLESAGNWIKRGIDIIEAGDFTYNGDGPSRNCYYIGCPFCGGPR